MRLARTSLVLMVALSIAVTGCNEIVGARRYHVRDAGARSDATVRLDAQIDASFCEPSEREVYYADGDGDGFGTSSTVEACELPVGFAMQAGDCNDAVGTAYPGASEICDAVDSDCDGTIDEGVFGPIGTPMEVIPVGMAGAPYHISAAAYDGGFLVVSGAYARWLDVNGVPTGEPFQFTTTVAASLGPTAAFVFEGTTPPRGIIGWSNSTSGWVIANGYSANMRTTALGSLQPYLAPTEGGGPGVLQVELVPIGNNLALLGLYDSGADEHVLRGGAVDPLTWSERGAFFETYVRSVDGAIPVEGGVGTLLSVGTVFGIGASAAFNWITLDASGNLAWGAQAFSFGGGGTSRANFPRTATAFPASTSMLFVREDSTTVCLGHVTLGNPNEVLTPSACEAAVTWSVMDMAMRGGVIGVVGNDGTYQELPFTTGTVGRPAIDAGIVGTAGRLAVRGGHGVIAYSNASALFVRPLGCQ